MIGKGKADMSKVSAAAAEIAREMKPQDSLVKVSTKGEAIFVPVELGAGDELSRIDGALLYRTLDPHNDGITKEQLKERLEQYSKSGGGEPLLDFIMSAAAAEGVGSNSEALGGRLSSGASDISCKWGGDLAKTNSGCGIYLIPLGGGRAVAIDYGINPSQKKPEISWTMLEGRDQISEFVCATVLDRDSPGFSVPGQDRIRKHTTLTLVKPTGGVLRVAAKDEGIEIGNSLPPADRDVKAAEANKTGQRQALQEENARPLPKSTVAPAKTKKKQVYTRKPAAGHD
jgi:hypothetical protein